MVRQAGKGNRPSAKRREPISLRRYALVAVASLGMSAAWGLAAETERSQTVEGARPLQLVPPTLDAGPADEATTAKTPADDYRRGQNPPPQVVQRLAIGGREIACQAASQWTPAAILRTRANTLVQIYCDEDQCARAAAQALANFLRFQASYQEDIGAASAMRAYYSRIAIVEQLALADESGNSMDSAEERLRALREQGISTGTDFSAFERRRLAVLDQRLQLESQDRQLRSLIAQLTNFDYASDEVYQESLDVQANSLNCATLKHLALSQRQDLCGWRYLAARVNQETAPEFAKMLPTLVGGWTLPLPTLSTLKNVLCPPDYDCLAANMKRELGLVIKQQEDWIRQSVDEKCQSLELSYRRIELAQRVVASWRERIVQLERLEEIGDGQPDERAAADMELLKARSEEISRRLEARIAEIDLAEALGGLAGRCCQGQAWLLTGNE